MHFLRLLLIISISCVQLTIYSQKKGLVQQPLKNSIVFIDSYTISDSCDYNIAFLATYLSHTYNLDAFHFDLQKVPVLFNDNWNCFNFYGPLIGLKSPLSKDSLVATYRATHGIEHILLWGIYADELSLDSTAQRVFYENSLPHANVRNVCHVAISLYWAKNKMARADKNYLVKFRNKYITNLKNGLVKMDQVNDDLLECMVGLLCMNKFEKIPKLLIDNLIKAQNADGGWAWDRSINTKSHPHTTVLAYWILLHLMQKN